MFGTAIVVDKVLISISRLSQILIITGVTMFPFLNIFGFLWVFYLLKNREIKDKKNAFDRLQILLKDIELYTNTGEYKNIKWKLTEISMGIEDVSKTLYKENETGT